jgi:hypothetical protein
MPEFEIPFQPLALLVFEDGSVRVETIDDALVEMERYPGIVRSFAFEGCEFLPDAEEVDDEPVDAEE